MKMLSLFSGAGGLDLGLESAGFEVSLCVESDLAARDTLRVNRPDWPLLEPGDIHAHRPEAVIAQANVKRGEIGLLAGGPPCQPFSKASYWVNGDTSRLADPRANTLAAYLAVAEAALPQVLLLENVSGLSYLGKQEALRFLVDGIERINQQAGTRYVPTLVRLNSANFGVPQIRERVYLMAERDGRVFEPPAPTHYAPAAEQYVTAWDAIGDLDSASWDDSLRPRGKWAALLPSIPEGYNYLWLTHRLGGLPLFGWRTRYWSFMLKLAKDRPSWTISAHPGPSTGPFHWRNRKLSIREICRLQTFPDSYQVMGSDSAVRRQLGNAVPPLIGEILGREIGRQFLDHHVHGSPCFLRQRATDCPEPVSPSPVPQQYLMLAGNHAAHPGVGQGPGALNRIAKVS